MFIKVRIVKTLKTAIVGLGRIGWQFHLPQLQKHELFDLTAAVDPVFERRKEAKEIFGLKCYESHTELLENEKPDLIVIASPTRFHHDQILDSFESDIDVLSDKPITVEFSSTMNLIENMNKTGRKLMVYQPMRCYAMVNHLKHYLEKDVLGKIFLIKCRWVNFDRRNDWQAFLENGGGVLTNYGAHIFDTLKYLFAADFTLKDCTLMKAVTLGDAEDVVKIILESGRKQIIDVEISLAHAFNDLKFEIYGKTGAIKTSFVKNEFSAKYCCEDDFDDLCANSEMAAAGRRYGSGEEIQWKSINQPIDDSFNIDFYDKVYKYFALNEKPFVSIEDTKDVMELIDFCRKENIIEL
jgi:predicted dehydrogenase